MEKNYEVIILGSGISSSLLATVLARHNVSVCMIDNATHPRFAIGESTVPETTTNLMIMSKLYDVPEIANLANFFEHRDLVGSSHGIKKGFSFCYHREKQQHNPLESTQTATLSPPFGPDCHWFRQDTDQYVVNVAIRYGADIYQGTKVTEFETLNDGVKVITDKGVFRCAFIIDGSGAFSPFALKMNIRHKPTQLKTHSRGLFTHMVGVGSWEDVSQPDKHGMPYRMDQTTLHHIFDGGWMWVIPFNNHAQSTNSLCSVGVMFDPRKWPKTDLPPEQEFKAFLERYPSIKQQFRNARAVRNWVSSGRIQYSSTNHFADRYFALPHAAAFIDPLFSNGLVLTTHAVNLLGQILIDSFKTGQLQNERLQMLDRQLIDKTQRYDELVSMSFRAFRSFELWNAWYRVWEIGTYFNTLGAMRCLLKYQQKKDLSFLKARYSQPYGIPLAFSIDGYDKLFHNMGNAIERVEKGELNDHQGAEQIYQELKQFKAMPYFITRRDSKHRTIGTFTLGRLIKMLLWGKYFGPKKTKSYYDFRMTTYALLAISFWTRYAARHIGISLQPLRLMLSSHSTKLKGKPECAITHEQQHPRVLNVNNSKIADVGTSLDAVKPEIDKKNTLIDSAFANSLR